MSIIINILLLKAQRFMKLASGRVVLNKGIHENI